ncbi:MAG: AI-2E family transporter [Desulfurivibrionaceae bacterium]
MQEKPPSPMVLRYFLILFLASILLVGWMFWPFLSILILSYLLTSVFLPTYKLLNRKLPDYLASFLTCVLVMLLVFIPLLFLATALAQEVQHLYEWGRGSGVNLALKLRAFQESPLFVQLLETADGLGFPLDAEDISRAFTELARVTGVFLYNQASDWATNIMLFLFNFLMMLLIIFYLLIEHDRLRTYILRLSPMPEDQGKRLFAKFDEITDAVLISNGICSLFQGLLGGIIFAAFSLGPPVLWGLIMAVLAFLPIVGIGLVLVPAALILGFKGDVAGAVILMVLYAVITVFIEYFLKAKMVGDRVRMHILLAFLGVIGGLSSFGLLGIIYGPLIIAAFQTLAEIYLGSYERHVKNLNLD